MNKEEKEKISFKDKVILVLTFVSGFAFLYLAYLVLWLLKIGC